ncbi:hypothetical protein WSK_3143 [Novosphingobium sp. Rr 2-17]|uniref:hypothetical protein n=1 Tax=Novosphingobium sp. Rr 2-17 TaxID=555793 RepID=UPI0002698234|nr:hypothetical protein [Novosphingobium sp. Rr 2-17]EIZ78261.1 hypothetical protein WSK_3143 [Novosphingobium sp. Rr 2-17]
MSLKDLLSLADDKLHEVFSRKPHDPSKARKPIIKGIERTRDQFLATEPAKGRKWFKVSNNVVELTLPFAIDGKNTFYVPGERAVEFLDKLKATVESGDLDKDIEAGAGERPVSAATSGKKRAGWSPERREAFKASIADRKAKPIKGK